VIRLDRTFHSDPAIPIVISPNSSSDAPVAGRTVAVVHADWHSCGSYEINVTQAATYRALGARVISVAVSDHLGHTPDRPNAWTAYIAVTPDMPADKRYYTGPPLTTLLRPDYLLGEYRQLIRGNHAAYHAGLSYRAIVPADLAAERIDLVHCNHFFCIPFVGKMLSNRYCPVVLETQDIQADQYRLRNEGALLLPPRATYEEMLAIELDWMRRADLMVHLNAEEDAIFRRLLPDKPHALIYPAVAPVPTGPGGDDIIMIASANRGNVLSVEWFLSKILPRAGDVRVAIVGNVDAALRKHNPALYERHRDLFRGRVDDVGAIYANAKLVLLPTSEGHGLSIKAVEALSSGLPLIATPPAFRGMKVDPAGLANVTLAASAEAFATALRAAATRPVPNEPQRLASDTRAFYGANFSPTAYRQAVLDKVLPLLKT
jgi:glycosyltransferase involved in cell wall biosynthesis